jgi:hypothetical protein
MHSMKRECLGAALADDDDAVPYCSRLFDYKMFGD